MAPISPWRTAKPTRTLIRQVLAAVSQFDKSCVVVKLRAARDRVRRDPGDARGPTPTAKTRNGREKRQWLAIRKLRKARKSLQKIADAQNAEPTLYPTRTGAKWSKAMVFSVLGRTAKRR